MISKKTTISTIIALAALTLITSPSVLTLGSLYALDSGSANDGSFVKDFFDITLNGQHAKNNDKTSSDEKFVKNFFDTTLNGKRDSPPVKNDKPSDPDKSQPKKSPTNSNQPCKRDDSQKGTHFYCQGTHHHCKPGPDNPKCVKT